MQVLAEVERMTINNWLPTDPVLVIGMARFGAIGVTQRNGTGGDAFNRRNYV